LGLGTGSTVRFFLEALARRVEAGELQDVVGVPTSKQTEVLARSLGIAVATLEQHPQLDLCVDGADEVDPELNLIKGLGGALLREKIAASASRRFVVIADEDKQVSKLGQRSPLPVEVLPFGWKTTAAMIERLGGHPNLRVQGGRPYQTDQKNLILDCTFGALDLSRSLAQQLDALPGVLGHGLFFDLANEVILGTPEGARVLTRQPRRDRL